MTAAPDKRPRRPRRGASRAEARAGVLFATPWMIGLTLFTLLPLILTFYLAQSRVPIIGLPQWVGLENYKALWNDPAFWTKGLDAIRKLVDQEEKLARELYPAKFA